jgi:hypothetical protein
MIDRASLLAAQWAVNSGRGKENSGPDDGSSLQPRLGCNWPRDAEKLRGLGWRLALPTTSQRAAEGFGLTLRVSKSVRITASLRAAQRGEEQRSKKGRCQY